MSDFGIEACEPANAATVADTSLSVIAPVFTGRKGNGGWQPPLDILGPIFSQWTQLIQPLLQSLDQHLDSRLVETLGRTIWSIVEHRHRNCGLLLSELGGFLCGPEHAPAGTKRLSNLLRSPGWKAEEIGDYLWLQACESYQRLCDAGQDVILLWDESVIEKPESQHSEGLSPVRSSKSKRLTRIKPGFFRPPARPVFVPGIHWLALLLVARSGAPIVVAMRWWGTRLPREKKREALSNALPLPVASSDDLTLAIPNDVDEEDDAPQTPEWLSDRRQVQLELLVRCCQAFGRTVTHIFDRGYAGGPWLGALHDNQAKFILRWPKAYHLEDEYGRKLPAWRFLLGKRSWKTEYIYDPARKEKRKIGVIAIRVYSPKFGSGIVPLWLVASRQGAGREPWYLLTNEPIETPEQAWNAIMAYARRWQIEACFRFNKSELALESPRLWTWERRHKLLMLATLAYSLLLRLLTLPIEWRRNLFRNWSHRTGKRNQVALVPLYRLRSALAALLAACHHFYRFYESSG